MRQREAGARLHTMRNMILPWWVPPLMAVQRLAWGRGLACRPLPLTALGLRAFWSLRPAQAQQARLKPQGHRLCLWVSAHCSQWLIVERCIGWQQAVSGRASASASTLRRRHVVS